MSQLLGKNGVKKSYGRGSRVDILGAYLFTYFYIFFVYVYIFKPALRHHFSLLPLCIHIFSCTKQESCCTNCFVTFILSRHIFLSPVQYSILWIYQHSFKQFPIFGHFYCILIFIIFSNALLNTSVHSLCNTIIYWKEIFGSFKT